jgi:hypothetical protein
MVVDELSLQIGHHERRRAAHDEQHDGPIKRRSLGQSAHSALRAQGA